MACAYVDGSSACAGSRPDRCSSGADPSGRVDRGRAIPIGALEPGLHFAAGDVVTGRSGLLVLSGQHHRTDVLLAPGINFSRDRRSSFVPRAALVVMSMFLATEGVGVRLTLNAVQPVGSGPVLLDGLVGLRIDWVLLPSRGIQPSGVPRSAGSAASLSSITFCALAITSSHARALLPMAIPSSLLCRSIFSASGDCPPRSFPSISCPPRMSRARLSPKRRVSSPDHNR